MNPWDSQSAVGSFNDRGYVPDQHRQTWVTLVRKKNSPVASMERPGSAIASRHKHPGGRSQERHEVDATSQTEHLPQQRSPAD